MTTLNLFAKHRIKDFLIVLLFLSLYFRSPRGLSETFRSSAF